ncbi:TPA: O-antigen translocase [Vibrio diabolicus]|uniref:O-antigen translocase n=1 Tax=Vibrio TaxID=662 RepID=UPI0014831B2C|nr:MULTISPECIES: O-antigen translocase [Vibrio]MCS0342418.1 O-antigen translocase [Vibrio diabolicus]NNN79245.1 O-antigen translocase [Vibrio sp. 11-4(1)]
MNLIKTSFLTLIATAIRLISGLVINKAISVFIGPSGLALIGQFQNSLTVVQTIAKGGINTGVTKYTAEYKEEKDRKVLWSTAFSITLLSSVTVSFFLFIFSEKLSEYIFSTKNHSYVISVLAFTLILFTINQLFLSILNGKKEIKKYISINISQSLYGLFSTTLLIYFFALDGALLALVTNQSIVFVIMISKYNKASLINRDILRLNFSKLYTNKLLKYSLMTLVTAFTIPVSSLIIRNYIGDNLSWDDAGYWQAITYISTMYLMVITTALSTYYLPRLSELNSARELKLELIQGYKIIIPLVICLSVIIFILKDFIVWLLFSEEFKPMLVLFKWQLVGDVLKIASWLLSYLIVAKAMMKQYIISEIFFALSLTVLSMIFVEKFGLVGVTYAYAINYVIYYFMMFIIVKTTIFSKREI